MFGTTYFGDSWGFKGIEILIFISLISFYKRIPIWQTKIIGILQLQSQAPTTSSSSNYKLQLQLVIVNHTISINWWHLCNVSFYQVLDKLCMLTLAVKTCTSIFIYLLLFSHVMDQNELRVQIEGPICVLCWLCHIEMRNREISLLSMVYGTSLQMDCKLQRGDIVVFFTGSLIATWHMYVTSWLSWLFIS